MSGLCTITIIHRSDYVICIILRKENIKHVELQEYKRSHLHTLIFSFFYSLMLNLNEILIKLIICTSQSHCTCKTSCKGFSLVRVP